MDSKPDSVALSQDDLRPVAEWAADCAERALPVFEKHAPADFRPREAIAGARAFARGGKRDAQLRSNAWSAYAAAREAHDPAAAAAARAAGLSAGVAYMHPLATPHQSKHALGPAVYAALALELAQRGDHAVGDAEIGWAIEHASPKVREVIGRMPTRVAGRSRLDTLFYQLDVGLRGSGSL